MAQPLRQARGFVTHDLARSARWRSSGWRLAHAIVYCLALPFIRTIVFTLGWIAVVVLFVHVVW